MPSASKKSTNTEVKEPTLVKESKPTKTTFNTKLSKPVEMIFTK